MTGKDVWRWILTKFDSDLIYKIYDDKQLVCKGFRTTVRDINSNRNRFITNLLDKNNFTKLVLWAAKNPPAPLEGITLADKELNELVDKASEKGVTDVLIKLLCENQERKAIQLFAFLQDEQSHLLDIPNQSIRTSTSDTPQSSKKENESIETSKQKQEVDTAKTDEKKIQKLAKKVDNLNEVLKERDSKHKEKIAELEKSLQQTVQKLNEKNQLYGTLLKENKVLTKQYEEDKKKWEKEFSNYKGTIKRLEGEVNKLQENLDNVSNDEVSKNDGRGKNKFQILVIGKPHTTTHFRSETIEFSFVEGNDVHDFLFPENYDAYWVLSYELENREQLLLKQNDSYSKLNSNKVIICKNFIEVRKQMNYFNGLEERIISYVRR